MKDLSPACVILFQDVEEEEEEEDLSLDHSFLSSSSCTVHEHCSPGAQLLVRLKGSVFVPFLSFCKQQRDYRRVFTCFFSPTVG